MSKMFPHNMTPIVVTRYCERCKRTTKHELTVHKISNPVKCLKCGHIWQPTRARINVS